MTDIVTGSPAASSGLAVGDVITGFDGRRVPSAARLRWYVATAGVGHHVALSVRRGAAERSVQMSLTEAPRAGSPAEAPVTGVAAEAARTEDE